MICGLAGIGLAGYGLASGRFDTEKRQQYFATWRGDKLVPPTAEVEKDQEDEKAKQASEKIAATEMMGSCLKLTDMPIVANPCCRENGREIAEMAAICPKRANRN